MQHNARQKAVPRIERKWTMCDLLQPRHWQSCKAFCQNWKRRRHHQLLIERETTRAMPRPSRDWLHRGKRNCKSFTDISTLKCSRSIVVSSLCSGEFPLEIWINSERVSDTAKQVIQKTEKEDSINLMDALGRSFQLPYAFFSDWQVRRTVSLSSVTKLCADVRRLPPEQVRPIQNPRR